MATLTALPSTRFEPLTLEVALSAVYLRQTFSLGFFESHYAAAALDSDETIILFDRAYDGVKGLRRVDPAKA
jgi:predicted nucleic acid-binding protein